MRVAEFRGLLRLLYLEGALAMAYDTWVCPAYLSGLAGELNINLRLVSLLIAVPWIGAVGQSFSFWIFSQTYSVKRVTLGMALLARAIWLIPLGTAVYFGYEAGHSGHAFPTFPWFVIVLISASFSSLLASTSGTVWMSWMKSIIPSRFQGRFFGYRQRFVTAAFVIANVTAAVLVGWKPRGLYLGYALQCALAVSAGLISVVLHSFVPDVPSDGAPSAALSRSKKKSLSFRAWIETMKEPFRDDQFCRILGFGAAFNGALQLASSYFPYYFTNELKISMSSVAIWTVLANLGAFLTSGFWGKKMDQSGSLAEILWWTGHGIAIAPLYYIYPSATLTRVIAPIDYLTNGMIGCGFSLTQTAALFRASPRKKTALYFSVYTALAGIAGVFGTLVGGHLAHAFVPWGGFRVLWVIASVARFGVLWSFGRRLFQSAPVRVSETELELLSHSGY